mgnify:CR=1 FL=1
MVTTTQTALVTGATSGLGFETAAQLAEQGYGSVIVTVRSKARARDARDRLMARSQLKVFESLEQDLDEIASADAADPSQIRRCGTPSPSVKGPTRNAGA